MPSSDFSLAASIASSHASDQEGSSTPVSTCSSSFRSNSGLFIISGDKLVFSKLIKHFSALLNWTAFLNCKFESKLVFSNSEKKFTSKLNASAIS